MSKYKVIIEKKQKLDNFKPISIDLFKNIYEWLRLELTYTSNAIEGNTLSRRETTLIIDKKITVGGKSLKEHLEAVNHAKAFDFINTLKHKKHYEITINNIMDIHSLILKGIYDDMAGRYRTDSVRIVGSSTILPNPVKVPYLMDEFISWLKNTKDLNPAELSIMAHYKLVTIHPFVDGNGRMARLLMNLILMQYNYPPIIIRIRDRRQYIDSLETANTRGNLEPYEKFMIKALERSIDTYMRLLKGDDIPISELMKIGELQKKSRVPISTIRHYLQMGLLSATSTTPSGYQMFDNTAVKIIKQITTLKKLGFLLKDIKKKLVN